MSNESLQLQVDINKVIKAIDHRVSGYMLYQDSSAKKKSIFREIYKLRCLELNELAEEMKGKYAR